jgi:hypothetical protein
VSSKRKFFQYTGQRSAAAFGFSLTPGIANSQHPGRYVLNGPGHVVNKLGEVIQTAIKPGTRVRVYYANMGDLRMVDHVVVLD